MLQNASARFLERMSKEEIVWLTTVRPDGTPKPTPVWFVLVDDSFLVYSQPNTRKLRNIQNNPRVSLHFNADMHGDDVHVVSGEAKVVPDAVPVNQVPAYIAKYADGIARLGMTLESYAAVFSVAICIKPLHLRESNAVLPTARLCADLLALSQDIRSVAFYVDGQIVSLSRGGLARPSSAESDKYEELIVNPSVLKLLSQRGNIDCGGLDYVLVRYGNYFQFVMPYDNGHLSICIEPHADPIALVEPIRRAVMPPITL